MPMIHASLSVVELKNAPELTTTYTGSRNTSIDDEDSEVESTIVDELPSCSSQLQYMKQIALFL